MLMRRVARGAPCLTRDRERERETGKEKKEGRKGEKRGEEKYQRRFPGESLHRGEGAKWGLETLLIETRSRIRTVV